MHMQEMLKATQKGDILEKASALNNLGIVYCEANQLAEVNM